MSYISDFSFRLADRAKMGPALANSRFLNWFSAADAGLACALIYLKMVLEISTAINPIDAGTVLADALQQNFPDGGQERAGFLFRQRAALAQRVEARVEQGFVRIDIAQTREEALVQEQRLELPGVCLEHFMEDPWRKLGIQWFRSKAAKHAERVRGKPGSPEFAGVIKRENPAGHEAQKDAVVRFGLKGLFRRGKAHGQVAAHPQVKYQVGVFQSDEQEFSSPPNVLDGSPDDLLCKLSWGRIRYSLLP